ncbi:nitrate transport permease nrtB [Anaerobacillus arseniciselenatis]|uniref:Nitrate transport permease nrtB n=1 Tax=Anaerobacillus arseniciselenatis TaxID=85682 RepID=A0A1S2LPP4_9BACI|nr:ABC transporter permease [Anaerobacillus arseniciselenatis]OIJ14093.1 nitrate transport permease nrtB [Anaerobacillus arseniciselenatis]
MEPPTKKKRPNKLFKIREEIPKGWYLLGIAFAFLSVFLIWSTLSWLNVVNEIFLPTPFTVVVAFFESIASAEFWGHIGISVYRVFMGFLLACLIGIPLGILAGTFKFAESAVLPLTEFIRYMPAAAFIPLIMVWAGIGESAKIMVIFIGCFFQLVLMVADDTLRINRDLLSASYTLGAKRIQVIFKVIVPALLPKLMSTMRLIMGWAWTYLIVAELVAANSGLGYTIMKAQRFLDTELIFVGILVIGLLGLTIDRCFAIASKKLFPWAEGGNH